MNSFPPYFGAALLILILASGIAILLLMASAADILRTWTLPSEARVLAEPPLMPPVDELTITKLEQLRSKLPDEDDDSPVGHLLYDYRTSVDVALAEPTKESILGLYAHRRHLRRTLTQRRPSQ